MPTSVVDLMTVRPFSTSSLKVIEDEKMNLRGFALIVVDYQALKIDQVVLDHPS